VWRVVSGPQLAGPIAASPPAYSRRRWSICEPLLVRSQTPAQCPHRAALAGGQRHRTGGGTAHDEGGVLVGRLAAVAEVTSVGPVDHLQTV
jgi:hypothetical protein